MRPQAEAVAASEAVRQAWQTAVYEILGPENTLPEPENPTRPWEDLLPTLCARYGEAAGLGLGLRIGRAFARQMIPHIAEETAFQAVEFRFLPWPRKMATGLRRLAALASAWFEMPVEVEAAPEAVLWMPQCCPFAPSAAEGAYRCTPWEGFLQEMLYWLSGGRLFAVRVAADRPTAFHIPQRPLH